jgi:hypothetical protein
MELAATSNAARSVQSELLYAGSDDWC